jgi:hypothetical protein
MKKFLLAITIFIFISMLPSLSYAQCDPGKFMDNCSGKLAEGYTFLKSYSIDGSKGGGKIEQSYVFSKDTNYLLTLCSQEGDTKNMVVTIFDSNRKQLISSYDKKSGKFLPAIGVRIAATGIYYLAFTFEGDGPQCGGCVVGFKR